MKYYQKENWSGYTNIRKETLRQKHCKSYRGSLDIDKRFNPPRRDIAILNMYPPNKISSKYVKQELTKLQKVTDKSIMTVEFSQLLFTLER